MTTFDQRYEDGHAMRALMAGGNQSHFAVPGIDRLAPDLRRIIDEALFGRIWTRPGLTLEQHCMCTMRLAFWAVTRQCDRPGLSNYCSPFP